MKTTQSKIIIIFSFIAACLHEAIILSMDTTFQDPTNINFLVPRFARKNLSTFEFAVSDNVALKSFDNQGNSVPLLNFAGNQELFKRFVDTSLPYNNLQTFGTAIMSGKYQGLRYDFKIYQNIGSHFFLSVSTNLLYAKLKNVSITPVNASNIPLTQEQINAISGFSTYLTDLSTMLGINPDCKDTIFADSVGPTLAMLGYTNSFQNFERIDFIDFTFQAGLYGPKHIFQAEPAPFSPIPYTDIVNLGIPIALSASMGLYDWLNIGISAGTIPFIPTDKIIPLNTTNTQNAVLIKEQGMCTIKPKPFVYWNGYLQAEQIIPRITLLVGISYAKQFATNYQTQDPIKFPNEIINESPTLHPWSIGNLTASAELDLSKNYYKVLPRIKFIYVCPLWGKSIFKTTVYAGTFGIDCVYDF